ncbi:ATP-binding protein [Thomasclavelia sp.]|uniref:ATP-binding protein n=1 Tax=Thomasclavelia sp. TaxID=3025757 RepID=UPI0025D5DE2E|nr:ATP-binding protein [Thomasclavelia sp.]
MFKGTTKAIFIDKREFNGPIQKQIEQAYQFVLRNIRLGAKIEGIYREDIYEIPPAIIRELLINSAVHRSYLDHGNIQVAIYDDRLEITFPGKLPLGQTIEKMKQGYSKIRNEALANTFSYINLIEH